MAESTLLLRFDAPFQSWGIGGKGTYRSTESAPTFSGVVGLIANAMGRPRDADFSDLLALEFGVRTDDPGVIIPDFYTAGTTTGVAKREETTQPGDAKRTFRDTVGKGGVIGTKMYLSGACFTVALRGDEALIQQVEDALLRPARALYLGRRSCPVNAALVIGRSEAGIEATLRDILLPESRTQHRAWERLPAKLPLLLPASPVEAEAIRQDVPVDFSDIHRRYRPRYVRRAYVASRPLIDKSVGPAATKGAA